MCVCVCRILAAYIQLKFRILFYKQIFFGWVKKISHVLSFWLIVDNVILQYFKRFMGVFFHLGKLQGGLWLLTLFPWISGRCERTDGDAAVGCFNEQVALFNRRI